MLKIVVGFFCGMSDVSRQFYLRYFKQISTKFNILVYPLKITLLFKLMTHFDCCSSQFFCILLYSVILEMLSDVQAVPILACHHLNLVNRLRYLIDSFNPMFIKLKIFLLCFYQKRDGDGSYIAVIVNSLLIQQTLYSLQFQTCYWIPEADLTQCVC